MKKALLLLALLAGFWQGAAGQNKPDTLWTRDLSILGSHIKQLQFTPDGKNIAICIGGGVYLLDIKTGEIVQKFDKFMQNCNSFTFSDDGTKLITSSDSEFYNNNRIIVWDIKKADTIRVFKAIELWNIKNIDSNLILGLDIRKSVMGDSKIIIFNITTGKIEQNITSYMEYYSDPLTFSKQFNQFAIISGSYHIMNIEIWDLHTLKVKTRINTNTIVNDLSFSSDGKYIVSAGSDGLIKIWDIENKKLFKSFKFDDNLPNNFCRYVKFSPNNSYLIAGGGVLGKFSTKIWSMNNFSLIKSYSFGAVNGLDINSDTTHIIIGEGSKLILLNLN